MYITKASLERRSAANLLTKDERRISPSCRSYCAGLETRNGL